MSIKAKGILFVYVFLGFVWGYKSGLDANRVELGMSEQIRAVNKVTELIEDKRR